LQKKEESYNKTFAKGHVPLYRIRVPKNLYPKSQPKNVYKGEELRMCDKNKVYHLYIIEKKTITEIADEENVSKQMISKILKEFPEYKKEKERRKIENSLKRKEKKREYIKQKREIEKEKQEEEEALLWGMMEQQRIHAMMMSKKRTLSTTQLVEYSLSQYIEVKGKLIYKNDFANKPEDLPKTFNIHKTVLPQFKDYSQKVESEKWNSKVEKEALSKVEKETQE
jgi:predicted DNA-binding protein YlxM (UPF0122 family)